MTDIAGRTPTVLLVDDHDDSRSTLACVLRAYGFDVREAATAADALRLARDRPDLVILDVVLPDRDGFAVCRELKADPNTAATPVLMVSGMAVGLDFQVRGLEGGADAYLTKPADPAVVVAHLRALLRLRRAEDAQARLAAIVESSADPIVSVDLNGVVRTWNPAAERVFGYTAAEMVGRPAFDLVPAGQDADARHLVRRVGAGERVPPYEAVRLRKDGREVPVSVSLSATRGPGGAVTGMAVVYRDLTEQRGLENRFRQAQKLEAVGRLAGGIAHDFNNLLTIINGYSALLLEALRPGDPARAFAAEMKRAGDRAAGLTRQLLAFSRQQVLAPRVLDLNAVLADLGRLLGRLLGADVELATALAPGLWPVKADPGQVEQVVMNLCVNARDAMPTGGKLTVETSNVELAGGYAATHPEARPGPHVLLAVSDTGVGMTDEVRAHAFEPFFTTKEAGKGTGLGLATVHGIVRQSGGHVDVYSEPGVGTTFKVYLPRAEPGTGSGTVRSADRAPPRGSEAVLVVEDEDAVRALTAHVLRAAGYAVLEAADGMEALALVRGHEGPIDLLVTDVVIPGVSGRRLAEQLLAARPGVKVLYLSGYTDDAVVRHGILEDRVHFLQKPFTPAALAWKVREVLDSPPNDGGQSPGPGLGVGGGNPG